MRAKNALRFSVYHACIYHDVLLATRHGFLIGLPAGLRWELPAEPAWSAPPAERPAAQLAALFRHLPRSGRSLGAWPQASANAFECRNPESWSPGLDVYA